MAKTIQSFRTTTPIVIVRDNNGESVPRGGFWVGGRDEAAVGCPNCDKVHLTKRETSGLASIACECGFVRTVDLREI